MKINLYEILVPANDNFGMAFAVQKHLVWDERVRKITGGLTIFKPARGKWVSTDYPEVMFADKVIPVRVACCEDDMKIIAAMTKEYYEQEKVMYYLVSNEVFFV